MVKGRQGLYLEAWKFSVYLAIPIVASVYYSDPETQRYWADYWQYIKYPENPNTNVKEKIQELAKEKEQTRQQRMAYKEQLRSLQEAANRTQTYSEETSNDASWWRRAGRWIGGGSTEQ
ncbi:unnamed protein product [Cylindrotheca closterium]|uniref:Uncharacterized protein n=1 Tax=Cylindrotheca closterium TaxID=2856 RepID=A0AAD2FQL9_9STRA|nr:unnamed protein product [Cylindrotheca closterium]